MTYWFLTYGKSQRDYSTFFEASTKCYPPWLNRLCGLNMVGEGSLRALVYLVQVYAGLVSSLQHCRHCALLRV